MSEIQKSRNPYLFRHEHKTKTKKQTKSKQKAKANYFKTLAGAPFVSASPFFLVSPCVVTFIEGTLLISAAASVPGLRLGFPYASFHCDFKMQRSDGKTIFVCVLSRAERPSFFRFFPKKCSPLVIHNRSSRCSAASSRCSSPDWLTARCLSTQSFSHREAASTIARSSRPSATL
jgi:hypothetical protein